MVTTGLEQMRVLDADGEHDLDDSEEGLSDCPVVFSE